MRRRLLVALVAAAAGGTAAGVVGGATAAPPAASGASTNTGGKARTGTSPGAGNAPGVAAPAQRLDAPEGGSPLDLVAARFGQYGDAAVRLELRTAEPFRSTALLAGSGRTLCVEVRARGVPRPDERVCVVSTRGGLRLRLTTFAAGAQDADSVRVLDVPVTRPDERTVAATIPFEPLGLAFGEDDWVAFSGWRDKGACLPRTGGASPCDDRLPDRGTVPLHLGPQELVGCEYGGPRQVSSGTGRRVALTFDDGPAPMTSDFLDVLEREGVPATFFVLGRNVTGHERILRRMLAGGHLIGNHSYTHVKLGAGGTTAVSEIRRTQDRIRAATGFTPCLFRPPYGSTSQELVDVAGAQRLTSVLWSADAGDTRRTTAAAIQARVLAGASDGAIILAHDGGGSHASTLKALRGEIRALKRRGYTFVTVADILGLNLIRR